MEILTSSHYSRLGLRLLFIAALAWILILLLGGPNSTSASKRRPTRFSRGRQLSFSPQSIKCNPLSRQCDCLKEHNIDSCSSFDSSHALKLTASGWVRDVSSGRHKCSLTDCLVGQFPDSEADILVRSDVNDLPAHSSVDKHHALVRLENHHNYPADSLDNVDMLVSYRLDSTLPTTYVDHYEDEFREDVVPFAFKKSAALWIQSNCNSEYRNNIIREVSKLFPVDSLGNCLRSGTVQELWPECLVFNDAGPLKSRYEKECLLSKYKFVFALENSEDDSYITEKLWVPLRRGTVPIYWGGADVMEYLPSPSAIVNYRDFDSPQALAGYLKSIVSNEQLYNKHLQWRSMETFPTRFVWSVEHAMSNIFCRICDLAAWRNRYVKCTESLALSRDLSRINSNMDRPSSMWPFIEEIYVIDHKENEAALNQLTEYLASFKSPAFLVDHPEQVNESEEKCWYPYKEKANGIDNRGWATYKISPNDISVAAKHITAYHHIVKNNINMAMMIESDIGIVAKNVGPEFTGRLQKVVENLPNDFDIASLAGYPGLQCTDNGLCRGDNGPKASSIYLISRKGALRMIKSLPLRHDINQQFVSEASRRAINLVWPQPTVVKL